MKPRRYAVLGGTGFIGRHLLAALAGDRHALTVLTRNRERHRAINVLPQVRSYSVDVYDRAALVKRFAGHDAVINMVGILNETRGATFAQAHVNLTATVIAACRQAGVARLHQMSSLNAGERASKYLKTRGEADALVRNSGLDWTIYRPSVVFGEGDGLVFRFRKLLKMAPVLPLARPRAKLAPVFVGDVVEAIRRCLADRESIGQVFELYGGDTYTLLQLVRMIGAAAKLRRVVLPLPDSLGWLQAAAAEWVPGRPFSRDNFGSLKLDAVGTRDGLARLGIAPRRFAALLPDLLTGDARERRAADARASQER
jgi:uncharacterized protein YbjT (DUF2867 family)